MLKQPINIPMHYVSIWIDNYTNTRYNFKLDVSPSDLIEGCVREVNDRIRCNRISQHYGLVPANYVTGNPPSVRVNQNFSPEHKDNGVYVILTYWNQNA